MQLARRQLLLGQPKAAAQEAPGPVHGDRALRMHAALRLVHAPHEFEALAREVRENQCASGTDDPGQLRERGETGVQVVQHVDGHGGAEMAVGKREAGGARHHEADALQLFRRSVRNAATA